MNVPLVRLTRDRIVALLLGAMALFTRAEARAQTAKTEPEALDAAGTELLNQRRLEEACPKFAESFRLKPGTGVLMRLALCLELSGKSASARAAYLDAAGRARDAGDSRVLELAVRRAAELEPRLSYLTIRLDASASDASELEVRMNGERLDPEDVGDARAVDPGTYVVEASARGRAKFQKAVTLGTPGDHVVLVSLPLDIVPSATRVSDPSLTEGSSWPMEKSFAIASGAVGVAGLAVGTVMGLRAGSKMSSARELCTNGSRDCSEQALELQDQAHGAGLISTFAFGVGLAGLAVGTALWLTAPSDSGQGSRAVLRFAPRVGVVPSVGPSAAGVRAVGSW